MLYPPLLRTEQNLVVCIDKSEVELTNKKRRRSRYHTAEDNYKQTRGIARPLCDKELLVLCPRLHPTPLLDYYHNAWYGKTRMAWLFDRRKIQDIYSF